MRHYSILIVDDDEVSNFLTERAITSEINSTVDTVTNGLAALDYLEKNEAPDLILLDLNMPLLNGLEFLEKMERLFKDIESKVIILSTSSRKDDIKSASKFQKVTGYLEKPLDTSELKDLAGW